MVNISDVLESPRPTSLCSSRQFLSSPSNVTARWPRPVLNTHLMQPLSLHKLTNLKLRQVFHTARTWYAAGAVIDQFSSVYSKKTDRSVLMLANQPLKTIMLVVYNTHACAERWGAAWSAVGYIRLST